MHSNESLLHNGDKQSDDLSVWNQFAVSVAAAAGITSEQTLYDWANGSQMLADGILNRRLRSLSAQTNKNARMRACAVIAKCVIPTNIT